MDRTGSGTFRTVFRERLPGSCMADPVCRQADEAVLMSLAASEAAPTVFFRPSFPLPAFADTSFAKPASAEAGE